MSTDSFPKISSVTNIKAAILLALQNVNKIFHSRDKQRPHLVDEAFITGGSDGDRTRNLPELHPGRSNQINNIFAIFLAF
jgi:hypothetical protein